MVLVCTGGIHVNTVPVVADWCTGSNAWANWRDISHGWPLAFYTTTQLKMDAIETVDTSLSWINFSVDMATCIFLTLIIALLFEIHLRGQDIKFRRWAVHRYLLPALCSIAGALLWLNLTPAETVSVAEVTDLNDVVGTYSYRKYSYGWPLRGVATISRAEQKSDDGYLLITPLQANVSWNSTLSAMNTLLNISILGLIVFIFPIRPRADPGNVL